MRRKEITYIALLSKPHYEVLDGLRGIAALAIVVFHFMEWIYSDFSLNFIGHGFLAVDFFFCLSGFVIGYAYDDRIQKMGIIEFFKSRLIRLHPLVILGSVLGLLALLFDPFAITPVMHSAGKLFLIFLSSVFLIPLPIMDDRSLNLFGLNAPAWSLFWEYVANVFYALVLYKLARRFLLVLVVIAAAILCAVTYDAGNLLGGWSGPTFWHGGARVLYSFSTGLLIYRYNWIIKNKLGFLGMTILLSLAFVFPYFKWNWLSEIFVVLVYFPLLVSLGAGTVVSPALKSTCDFSGKISYPLYMTHYAAIWIFSNYLINNKPTGTELSLVVIFGTIILVIFAFLVMVLYDIPVRRYLQQRRKKI